MAMRPCRHDGAGAGAELTDNTPEGFIQARGKIFKTRFMTHSPIDTRREKTKQAAKWRKNFAGVSQ